jgi:hypothetical protein
MTKIHKKEEKIKTKKVMCEIPKKKQKKNKKGS